MKRITISLPDELADALQRQSHRERKSVSEIARKAIEARLNPLPIVNGKRQLPFAALGRSKGNGNIARDIEEIMDKEWTIENLIDRDR
jgi:hypothetical protein